MPVVTTSEKPAFPAAKLRGLLLVASPGGCAVAVLNRKDIRGDTRFNQI